LQTGKMGDTRHLIGGQGHEGELQTMPPCVCGRP